MRTRLLCVACALLLTFGGVVPSQAFTDGSPEAVAADTLVVRPFCLVATILGGAVFVVSLPAAAITKSIDKTADALVKAPAKATFSRPLGNLSSLTP
jgi:hypothetical protein